jgi:hypothetical protein
MTRGGKRGRKQKEREKEKKKRVNEVGEIMKLNLWDYEGEYKMTPKQRQVVNNIINCRTKKKGGHVLVCGECGASEIVYNPCKDRHCPNCGAFEKAQWLEKQRVWMLPISYYHIVFTIDHELNEIMWANQKVMYNLLFKIVAGLLKKYGQEYLGGEVGFTMVMHTWGQTMQRHPHVHVIYTGGALVKEGKEYRWQEAKDRFLFPVVKLSAEFRGAYCKGIRKLMKKDRLWGEGGKEEVKGWIEEKLEKAEQKDWEVYIQKPKEGTENLVEYLGKYIFRTAIGNHRIVSHKRGEVKFEYYDNRDGGKKKEMKLSGVEFIRRYLWHVMPPRFHRVRHYGLHHSSARRKLKKVRELLGLGAELPEVEKLELVEWLKEIMGIEADPRLCPKCGKGLMESILEFGPSEGARGVLQLAFAPIIGKAYQWGLLG